MIETFLYVVIFVLVIAVIASLLPIDARAKNIIWIVVLCVILLYFVGRL